MEQRMLIQSGKWYAEFDEACQCTAVSYDASFRRLLGYETVEEYSDTNEAWLNSIHPEDLERVERYFNECSLRHTEETDYDIEYRMMTKWGYHRFHDYAHITRRPDGSPIRWDGVIFDIQNIIDEGKAHQLLSENHARFFALEDSFEALYDVDLESGFYVSYDRDEFYKRNVSDNVVSSTEFFEGLRTNVDRVVYEEDREETYRIQTREGILKGLSGKDHIDHYYRIVTEDGLLWLKMRIVYKDSDKRNVIIGIFNAEEEMAAKEKDELVRKELIQTNARLFALEDTFESLYDVEMESGHYDVFVKGDFYRDLVADKLSVPHDYFEELRANIDAVIYPEDRDGLYDALTRESIRRELSDKEHFDYYYRLNSEKGPIWFKMRIVYKDPDKQSVIIGVFNAADDVEAQQIAEQKAQLEESLTFTNFFLDTYISAYYVDFEKLSCQVYKRTTELETNYPIITNYLESITEYIERDVHPDDREMLLSAVQPENMKAALREKKEYSHIFRDISGGVEKTYRMQVIRGSEENHVAFGFIDISDEVSEQRSRIREAEEAGRLVNNIALKYHVAYSVNMAEDSFRILRMDDHVVGKGMHFDSFSETRNFLVEKIVHPADRERMRNELRFETIRERLHEAKTYDVEYKTLIDNATIWHVMTITSINADTIAMGFVERDLEITKHHLENKRYDEYLALFAVDLDTGMIQAKKTSPLFVTAEIGVPVPYGPALRQFADSYEGDIRDFFTKFSDIGYARKEFAVDDKRTYSFKSTKLGRDRWVDVVSYVIERHEDGTPAMFTLGFSLVDALATVRQELQEKVKEDMQMIGGLAGEYHVLCYYRISDEVFKVYSINEEKFPIASRMIRDEEENPFGIIRNFAGSELVHPDDRHLFEEIDEAFLKEKLSHTKKYNIRFRRNFNGEYLWTDMDFIKYEDVDEEANAVAIGFAEHDAEIRNEQALSRCFNILGMDISPNESINELLTTAGEYYNADRAYIFEYCDDGRALRNSFEWCREGIEPMIDNLQDIPLEDVEGWMTEFKRQGAFWMDTLDEANTTEEGREKLAMQGITNLIAAPMMNNDEIVGFIGVDNPTKARTNIEILRNVAVVAYSEILKRNQSEESQKLIENIASSYDAAFVVNMDDDTYKTLRLDKNIAALGVSPKTFSEVRDFLMTFVHASDRERMTRELGYDTIRSKTEANKSYDIEFRAMIDGGPVGYIMNVTSINSNEAALGFAERDNAIIEQHLWDAINDEYFALFSIDIESARLKVVKKSPWDDNWAQGQSASYQDVIRSIGKKYSGEARAFYDRIIDLGYVRDLLREENKFSYSYQSEFMEDNKWISVIGRALARKDDGTPEAFTLSFIMIDALEREKQELRVQLGDALSKANVASESKSNFLFNMSHDIRTPMNAITGFTGMAKKYIDDKTKVSEYLDKIEISGRQLLSLINQVLEMSRIESGKVELNERPVSVREKYDSLVTTLSEQANLKGLTFRHELKNVKHDAVMADEAKMSQITLNIIGNAIKYTPEGGSIDFSFEEIPCDRPGYGRFVMTVSDTGIGMSEEYQKKLFQPFEREKSSTVSHIQGTGLGLSIVKNLVDVMGGEISVDSKLGEGTRFVISLDLAIVQESGTVVETVREVTPEQFAGRRVLLVEDNEMNREIARDILEEEGLIVEEAEDGDIAVRMVREIVEREDYTYYDFILMDVQMPRMNGYEATRAIRAIPAPEGVHVPIIAMTANAFEEDRKNALAAGMDEHLAKPIEINVLFSVLRKFL